MICYKGKVLTVDSNDTVAGYLVEDKGRIVYVGNELPEQYKNVQIVELGKKVLVPAFVDTHQHMASFSTFHAGLNVMDAESNEEIAQMVKEFVQSSGNKKTLIAFGASPYSVKEGRLISREELDKVCPDKEIMVVKYDGHACIINSKLLDKLKGKVSKLRGYHEDTGEMNQEAFFACSDYITNSLSIIELFKNMQIAIDFQASHGIGCIHTVSGVGFTGNLDITFEKIFAKSLTNGFQVRVFPQSMNVDVALKRKLPRIGGCFECALDGCFGSHDAAMNEPYIDSLGGDGVLYYDDEKVIDFCKKANRAGLQIEMHAIGDKAFDQACRALKAALDDYPRKDHRHGIIHDCLPTEEGIKICRDYNIQMPVQSAFINWKQEPDEYLESIMGKERTERLNPLRTFNENAIVVSCGSDNVLCHKERLDGFKDYVNQHRPDINIVTTVKNSDNDEDGYTTTKKLLEDYPDVNALFISSGGISGICKAIKEANKVGKITVIASGRNPVIESLIKEGIVTATISQNPVEQGKMAVLTAFNMMTTNKKPDFDKHLVDINAVLFENCN